MIRDPLTVAGAAIALIALVVVLAKSLKWVLRGTGASILALWVAAQGGALPANLDGVQLPAARSVIDGVTGFLTRGQNQRGDQGAALTVVRVVDGDTIVIRAATGTTTIRVAGIDAPESSSTRFGSPECGGRQSTAALARAVGRGPVRLIVRDRDRYGRTVAIVLTAGGTDAGLAVVRAGWARAAYLRGVPSGRRDAYVAWDARARRDRLGLHAACRGSRLANGAPS